MTRAWWTAGSRSRVVGRPGRRTNVALLALMLGSFATGVLAFATGTATEAELVAIAHGAFGLGLLLLVPWKSVVVRRGLSHGVRRSGRRAGVPLGLLLLVSLATGVLHAVGGYISVFGFSMLTAHVAAAVLPLPLLVSHVRGRRQRLRRADLSRRTVLRAGALGIGSLAAYTTIEATAGVLGLPGGWYAEQEWQGVRLDRLVDTIPAGTRSIDVVSVTGYRRRFPLDDLDRLLLATHAAGQPLSDGHGGPVRLVAPDRRGFWWVKWVVQVSMSTGAWWLQPPFPLQ